MFKILEPTDKSAVTLQHSENVFHEALARGEEYYHVKCEDGDYDLEYAGNNATVMKGFLQKNHVKRILPEYLEYNENDLDTIYLDYFDMYKALFFEEANEYTVVSAKLALEHSTLEVYTLDPRLALFTGKNERLHIVKEFPELPEKTFLRVSDTLPKRIGGYSLYYLRSAFVFHNLFFLQGLLEGKDIKNIKYLEYDVEERSGIASIIIRLTAFKNAFAPLGIKVGIKRGSGRYSPELIEKYFNIDILGDDSTEENTMHIDSVAMLVATAFYSKADKSYGADVMKPALREQMDEYFDALFKGKKVLGLLIRGTDYYTTGQVGERIMASADDMIPEINKWLEEEKYDNIFLASEDADVCEKMFAEYGSKLRMLSQERHRVSDFKDVTIISELEKKEKTGKEYADSLEDTTINYFYALYMLSKCDSFMCSGQCNGYDMVCAFNGNKFNRLYKFSIGLNQ